MLVGLAIVIEFIFVAALIVRETVVKAEAVVVAVELIAATFESNVCLLKSLVLTERVDMMGFIIRASSWDCVFMIKNIIRFCYMWKMFKVSIFLIFISRR